MCSVTEDTSCISGSILPLSLHAEPTVILNYLDLYSTEEERWFIQSILDKQSATSPVSTGPQKFLVISVKSPESPLPCFCSLKIIDKLEQTGLVPRKWCMLQNTGCKLNFNK